MPKAKLSVAKEIKETVVPDWFKTPEDLEYSLDVFYGGAEVQCIDITRGEFIALKRCLAKLRGFAVQEVSDAS